MNFQFAITTRRVCLTTIEYQTISTPRSRILGQKVHWIANSRNRYSLRFPQHVSEDAGESQQLLHSLLPHIDTFS